MIVEHYQFTLALFTLLAPVGAIAFVVMALPCIGAWEGRLTSRGNASDSGDESGISQVSFKEASTAMLPYHRISRYLIIPLATAMVGLIASATHLGTPSNALYVLMGWGRSPLSNEVVAALLFLGLAGVYWLSSFRMVLSLAYARVALVLSCAASLFLVWEISVVYAIRTIITWNTDATVLSLWGTALCGGVLLGITSLVVSGGSVPRRYLYILCATGLASFVGAVAAFVFQWMQLPTIANWTATASQLAPQYGWDIALFVLSGLIGWVITLRALFYAHDTRFFLRSCVVGTAVMFAGIYLMRLVFYSTHMTGGFL